MKYKSIADTIIELKNADLDLRDRLMKDGLLGKGYNHEMKQLHNSNAEVLNKIIQRIGYPTTEKVGTEAHEAAWLVIQHAIGLPDFMRKCAALLKTAVSKNQASPLQLAYLTDRIATFEGKPQLYGTQFDWDEDGVLNPEPFDDLSKVNERRNDLGLNTLEEQTIIIRRRAVIENNFPPLDRLQRKMEMDEWRKSVGWVK